MDKMGMCECKTPRVNYKRGICFAGFYCKCGGYVNDM